MKKRIFVSVLTVCILLNICLCACSGGKKSTVSMYDLKNAMAGATENFSDMTYASSEDADAEGVFANVSDMDYSKVESFFIYYATNGTGNSDEIAVIQVKNASDLDLAKQSLEAHLQKRTALYSTYDKSQLKKLEAAKTVVSGNCAALIVADDTEKIANAFSDFLK